MVIKGPVRRGPTPTPTLRSVKKERHDDYGTACKAAGRPHGRIVLPAPDALSVQAAAARGRVRGCTVLRGSRAGDPSRLGHGREPRRAAREPALLEVLLVVVLGL